MNYYVNSMVRLRDLYYQYEKRGERKKMNTLIESDDSFYSILGCRIIEILEECDMLKKVLIRTEKTKQHYILTISDKSILSAMGKHKIYTVPNKLPMIVKPKPYSANTSGGYLLNDIQFNEDIFIEKKAYSV